VVNSRGKSIGDSMCCRLIICRKVGDNDAGIVIQERPRGSNWVVAAIGSIAVSEGWY
jgi:hypothetical protein